MKLFGYRAMVLWLVLLGVAPTSWADHTTQPIITDRPDGAESSVTVGPGHLQVESSFGFTHDRNNQGVTTRTYSFPTLLRVGFLEWLEGRMEGEMVAWRTRTGHANEVGFTDLAFGFKAHFIENREWIPSLSVLTHVNTPTGRDSYSANAAEPVFKLLADWPLPRDFSLAGNVGFDVPVRDDEGDKFARFLYAVSVGIPSPLLRDHLRLFVETAGIVPAHPGKADEHSFDTGLTYSVTDDFQLDTFVQVGLTDATTDITTGLGFSWRL